MAYFPLSLRGPRRKSGNEAIFLGRIFLIVCVVLLTMFLFVTKAQASYDYGDYRVLKLQKFLTKYQSPLVSYASHFVRASDRYGLDYRLLPAITGVESTFGLYIPENSYNAYGWNNGNWQFKSWPDSIFYVSKALRENYLNRGATSVWQIAPIYNPVTPASWGLKVHRLMEQIDQQPPIIKELLALRLTI